MKLLLSYILCYFFYVGRSSQITYSQLGELIQKNKSRKSKSPFKKPRKRNTTLSLSNTSKLKKNGIKTEKSDSMYCPNCQLPFDHYLSFSQKSSTDSHTNVCLGKKLSFLKGWFVFCILY